MTFQATLSVTAKLPAPVERLSVAFGILPAVVPSPFPVPIDVASAPQIAALLGAAMPATVPTRIESIYCYDKHRPTALVLFHLSG